MTDEQFARAHSFDAWAGEYDRFRPGYPDELFDIMTAQLTLPRVPHAVVLGAGTGRASLAMAARGWRVTAVEPGKSMLDVLRGRAANDGLLISTVQASAEETGLETGSADLVTAAQAFHWFDQPRALTEIARILKPGGGLALFWNVRDAGRSTFLADYAQVLHRYVGHSDGGRYESAMPEETTRRTIEGQGDAFADVRLAQLHHEVQMTGEEFVGMVFTASYVRINKTPQEQDRFRLELAALLGRHHLNDGRPFAIPYRLDLWTARRSDR
jgi:SAM-dependent methyltransferase